MSKKNSSLVQAGKFSAVGIINTIIDFGILNVLNVGFGVPRIPANIVSTTIAMTFSFLINKRLVFNSSGKNYLKQAVSFLLVTAFGLYVLQNGIIYIFTEAWTGPLNLAHSIIRNLGFGDLFSQEFIFTNGSKAAATVVSLVWNFLWYKKVVFASGQNKK